MSVDMEQTARHLNDVVATAEAETLADAEAREIAAVLFPGVRQLASAIDDANVMLRDNWYNASFAAHRDTFNYARFLSNELLPHVRDFFRTHRSQFLSPLAKVYLKDVTAFDRAATTFFSICTEMGVEELKRSSAMSEFVLAQPNILDKMTEMRKEYESGNRTRFADSGLGKKKA